MHRFLKHPDLNNFKSLPIPKAEEPFKVANVIAKRMVFHTRGSLVRDCMVAAVSSPFDCMVAAVGSPFPSDSEKSLRKKAKCHYLMTHARIEYMWPLLLF